ncbi:MAG: extracellular solute-binding protein [Pseudomonadota bacterium]
MAIPSRALPRETLSLRATLCAAALLVAPLVAAAPTEAADADAGAKPASPTVAKPASPTAAKPASPNATATHAIAMHGTPALPPGFAHFPYVNPQAPRGGRLMLGATGTFDSLNPFIIKGVTPPGIRGNVYESLLARARHEPFTLYGLIARSIEVAPDRSAVTFNLNPKAAFSDGTPLTADDVIFSHALLRDRGRPFHRSYYAKVVRAEKLSRHRVRFAFADGRDREMVLIMGLMPILPRHVWQGKNFTETTLDAPIGSGPYVVDQARVDPGRNIVYKRNPRYWARDLPVNRGRFNVDEIHYRFFLDAAPLFDDFRLGNIDFRIENDPLKWAEGYNFAAVREGRVIRRTVPLRVPAGMNALVFNTRRAPFNDVNVRRALIALFDFEWINATLYSGLYTRSGSFFSRSALSSRGKPATPAERALLAPFKDALAASILDGSARLPVSDGSGRDRAFLRRGFTMLRKAGYAPRDGVMVNTRTGTPLTFEFLARSKAQARLMLAYARTLERLGIKANIRRVDSAQYWSRLTKFDFDMIQWGWRASLSPGNEQLNRWTSEAASREGSLNYAGARSPAVDAMIDALLAAQGAEDFRTAVRAYDRALLSGDYVIPLFHLKGQWVAHWDRLAFPKAPTLWGYGLDTAWRTDLAN